MPEIVLLTLTCTSSSIWRYRHENEPFVLRLVDSTAVWIHTIKDMHARCIYSCVTAKLSDLLTLVLPFRKTHASLTQVGQRRIMPQHAELSESPRWWSQNESKPFLKSADAIGTPSPHDAVFIWIWSSFLCWIFLWPSPGQFVSVWIQLAIYKIQVIHRQYIIYVWPICGLHMAHSCPYYPYLSKGDADCKRMKKHFLIGRNLGLGGSDQEWDRKRQTKTVPINSKNTFFIIDHHTKMKLMLSFCYPIFESGWLLFGPPWRSPGFPGLRFKALELDPRKSRSDLANIFCFARKQFRELQKSVKI